MIKLFALQVAFPPIMAISQFVQNHVTRSMETAADNHAIRCGHGEVLREALVTLGKKNKAPMAVDSLYSSYFHSHPTLVQRLQNIDSQVKQDKKKKN